jgi:hypothetical protein
MGERVCKRLRAMVVGGTGVRGSRRCRAEASASVRNSGRLFGFRLIGSSGDPLGKMRGPHFAIWAS